MNKYQMVSLITLKSLFDLNMNKLEIETKVLKNDSNEVVFERAKKGTLQRLKQELVNIGNIRAIEISRYLGAKTYLEESDYDYVLCVKPEMLEKIKPLSKDGVKYYYLDELMCVGELSVFKPKSGAIIAGNSLRKISQQANDLRIGKSTFIVNTNLRNKPFADFSSNIDAIERLTPAFQHFNVVNAPQAALAAAKVSVVAELSIATKFIEQVTFENFKKSFHLIDKLQSNTNFKTHTHTQFELE